MSTAPASSAVSVDSLLFLFDFNHRAFGLNAAGFTHAESLVPAAAGANCANWIVGHMIDSRSAVLELLGQEPLWNEAKGKPFNDHAAWSDPEAVALPWESLLADFEASQERLRAGLAAVTPERLAAHHKPESKRPRGMQLNFLQFHEAYHVGQVGLMRRIVGKSGAI